MGKKKYEPALIKVVEILTDDVIMSSVLNAASLTKVSLEVLDIDAVEVFR